MSLWSTPAGRTATPFDTIHAPSFARLLRRLREASEETSKAEQGKGDEAQAAPFRTGPPSAEAMHRRYGRQPP